MSREGVTTDGESSFARPLGVLTLLLTMAAWVRLAPVTGRPFPFFGHDLVRWRELLTMFVMTPLITWSLWDLKRRVRLDGWLETAYVLSLVILLVSMGIHEPMNALYRRAEFLPPDVAATVKFWDDDLSHWTFFVGFISINLLLVAGQLRCPRAVPESRTGFACITGAALVLAAVIARNMIGEPTQLDIAVGLITLALAGALWMRRPVTPTRVPLVFALVLGFALGFGAAGIAH